MNRWRKICRRLILLCTIAIGTACIASTHSARGEDLTLRYTQPAKDWMTEALPIGNGRMGGMLFGGVDREHLQFNEDSLWTGDENDTGSYQNFGDLFIDFTGAGAAPVVSCPSGQTHPDPSQNVASSFDGDPNTKWCVEHGGKPVIWEIDLPAEHTKPVTSYAITSAEDVPERDPKDWKVSGSNDGRTWTLLDERKDQPIWPTRHSKRSFTFNNTTAYRRYRIEFTEVHGVTHFQVAEIELGPDVSSAGKNIPFENYRRQLDIGTAVAGVAYRLNGTTYQREAFCSHADQVLVMHFAADQPGKHSGRIHLADAHGAKVAAHDNRMTITGSLNNGLKYEAQVLLLHEGGTVEADGDGIAFTGADRITILLNAGTNYLNKSDQHWRGPDPHERITRQIDNAAAKSYAALRSAHVADYQALFNRVALHVGDSDPQAAAKETNQRLAAYSAGTPDPELEALFFQFGRYLLISSSRPGSLPANLQGLWNNSNNPPWRSDFHSDINVEMNYWPSDVTNLSECFVPLFDWVNAARVVRTRLTNQQYHVRGWTVKGENGAFGGATWEWVAAGSAWLCQNLWDHYAFTGDKEYLQKLYPILKEVCEFWQDRLKALPDGTLVAPSDFSPEQMNIHEEGVSFAQELVWDVFTNYAQASQTLNIDPDERAKVTAMREKLLVPKIGKWGQLQEWMNDHDNPNDTHRHTSHLIALYPGRQISPRTTPALAEAAKVSLIHRGDESTGWAMAWRINLWARLLDGDHAYRLLHAQLHLSGNHNMGNEGGGTCGNLLDSCPPFQIDGNFGATAGMAEMLLQSQTGTIDLLPALPAAWTAGSVSGLRARGGYEVAMKWKDRKLVSATIFSTQGGPCHLRYGNQSSDVTITKSESYTWKP